MTEYHFEGVRKDGSRWVICGKSARISLDKAREEARKLIDEKGFERVDIYTLERRTVEEVKR